MIKALLATAALLLATPALAAPDRIAATRDKALKDDVAWDIVEGLTTEIGQRLAGTEAEARARDWAVAKLKALGFANVHVEPFQMDVWRRGEGSAEVISPFSQKLILAALGTSPATPPEGITAEVVGFPSLAALEAVPDGALKGKIAFVWHRMVPTQDGSGYGPFGDVRRKGPALASRKGAVAIVIRSAGTDYHRNPHVGATDFGTATPIPAAALALPDSDQLERILKRGKPVTLHLLLTPHVTPNGTSGNVVAEVPGRDPNAGVILIGGHLDSWDLGTGAIDDGAGVAIMTAAAKQIMDASRPLHTIRVVWFGAEEEGGYGGDAYGACHKAEKHYLTGESDFGADNVWKVDTRVLDPKAPAIVALKEALLPLGIEPGANKAHGGEDVGPIAKIAGVPIIDMRQNGLRYFDIHHTPDDTLDKIDPAQLRQNVAAWTTMLAVAAESTEVLGPVAGDAN
jgi:carboxypeptidase Q